jgi:MFS family permease
VPSLRARARESLAAFREVGANRPLRRLQLAFAGSETLKWAGGVAIAVYAFERGGATAVGVQLVTRMVPAGLIAPFASTLADRYDRVRVMVGSDLVRLVLALGMAAAVARDAPLAVVFAIASVSGIVSTCFEPAKAALTPSLARSPRELTAANVVTTSIDSVSMFAGPALGGLLLAATSAQLVFVCTAAGYLWSASLLVGVRPEAPGGDEEGGDEDEAGSFLSDAREGVGVVLASPALRVLFLLIASQLFVDGLLNVLVVSVALDLLDIGEGGVGYLNAVLGVGALAGVLVSAGLVGARRLAPSFALGNVAWGAPIALIAAVPEPGFAAAMMALVGIGNTFVDVSGVTLLQRAAPEHALGRVFGLLDAFTLGSMALGGIAGPILIHALGIKGALVAAGCFLPALVALRWAALLRLDADSEPVPERDLALLSAIPIFAPLRGFARERLASRLIPVHVPSGATLFSQGDPGDRFYVIAEGEVEVLVDGARVRTEGPGEWFGEIALLREMPRTATVRALEEVELRGLERDEFLGAVAGDPRSAEAADAVAAARLATAAPAVARF